MTTERVQDGGYEAPCITEVGSVRELTQGAGVGGNYDSYTSPWGYTIPYGNPSSH